MGGNTKSAAKNSLKGAATVVVNPLLPVIDRVSGTTAWYLFTDPSWDRPAFRYGHLRECRYTDWGQRCCPYS